MLRSDRLIAMPLAEQSFEHAHLSTECTRKHRVQSALDRWRCCGLLLVFCLWSSPASGQTPEELSIRRFALERAETEAREGHHHQALELAQRAGAIQMTPSVRFFIARELVAVGRRAEGLLAAQTCLREAEPANVVNRDVIRAMCRQLIDSTRPLVGNLLLRPPPGDAIAGLEVQVEQRAVSAMVLGLPLQVDPGVVRVVARAPGRAPFERTIPVAAGQNAELQLELPLETTANRQTNEVPPRTVEPAPSMVGPAVLWGVGSAALVSSAVLFVVRANAVGACSTRRDPIDPSIGLCPSETALNAANQRDGLAVGVGVLAAVGVGAIAGGFGWWAAQRRTRSTPTVAVTPHSGGATIVIGGSL